MKKIYTKPEAELISFYSNEEITALDDPDGLSGGVAATFSLQDKEGSWS